MSQQGQGEGPLLSQCPREWLNPGFLLRLLSSTHPPKSPLLLSDLEVRINHQEVRGLGADLVLQLLGVAQTGPSPSWLPQL